jgi:cytochrome c556
MPPKSFGVRLIAAVSTAVMATSLAATPADDVRLRVTGLRELGAAFKSATDGLRGGEVQTILVQQAARQIVSTSRQMPRWFPSGSGPQPGLKTAAKPEIWARPAQFRAAQDRFIAQASVFQRAGNNGNADAIRAEARNLGATRKGCHDAFRVPKQD